MSSVGRTETVEQHSVEKHSEEAAIEHVMKLFHDAVVAHDGAATGIRVSTIPSAAAFSRASVGDFREAHLPRVKTLEPHVTAAKMRDLAEGGYIERAEPVLFIGECDPATFCTSLLRH